MRVKLHSVKDLSKCIAKICRLPHSLEIDENVESMYDRIFILKINIHFQDHDRSHPHFHERTATSLDEMENEI